MLVLVMQGLLSLEIHVSLVVKMELWSCGMQDEGNQLELNPKPMAQDGLVHLLELHTLTLLPLDHAMVLLDFGELTEQVELAQMHLDLLHHLH